MNSLLSPQELAMFSEIFSAGEDSLLAEGSFLAKGVYAANDTFYADKRLSQPSLNQEDPNQSSLIEIANMLADAKSEVLEPFNVSSKLEQAIMMLESIIDIGRVDNSIGKPA